MTELAGLIWVGRLLFLGYALPAYSYTILAYEWPCRDYYPSQPDRLDAIRKKYLIRGCYTMQYPPAGHTHLPVSEKNIPPYIIRFYNLMGKV
jgi:hypothetical protein